jgi:methyl-accepting chemotaxis protein
MKRILRKLKDSLVGKIMLGYVVIITLAVATTLVSMYAAWQNRSMDKFVSDACYPMILALKETEMIASESLNLTNNWVYRSNAKDKEKLLAIHTSEVGKQAEDLLKISAKMEDAGAIEEAHDVVSALDALMGEEQVVTDKLRTAGSYTDSVSVDEAISVIERKVMPSHKSLINLVAQASAHQNELLKDVKARKDTFSSVLTYLYITNIVLFLVIGIYARNFSTNAITKPIAGLSDLITMLSQGKFVSVTLEKGKDEIGKMAEAIENMLIGLKVKAEFAYNIGKGNYESNFQLLSEEDAMGDALIQMRDNLKRAADEDRKRNWTTEGLAKFADILRSRTNNLAELSDNIITNLVKYMKANQGALFLVNDENQQEAFVELVACYAYDRKKYINRRIEIGEGITGQCIQEKGTIYMTAIPEDYMKITSGLGDALPRNLLVVPLRLDEQIFGAVELASFRPIEPHHIEFVEKLGESIASTISAAKVNNRTRKLLEETQVQAEQMRAQEEEMRQNMEELSATQEEMHRAQRRSEELLHEMRQREEDLVAQNRELQRQLDHIAPKEESSK